MKQKKIIFLSFILINFLLIEIVSARVTTGYKDGDFIVQVPAAKKYRVNQGLVSSYTVNGIEYPHLMRQQASTDVYCINRDKVAPAIGSSSVTKIQSCGTNLTLPESMTAAIGSIVISGSDYGTKSYAIHAFIHDYKKYYTSKTTFSCAASPLCTAAAEVDKNYADSASSKYKPTIGTLTFELNNNYYKATASTNCDSSSCSSAVKVNNVITTKASVSFSNGQVTVSISSSDLYQISENNTKPNIVLDLSRTVSYNMASFKSCGDFQPIAESSTTSESKTYKTSSSASTIELDICLSEFKPNSTMKERVDLYERVLNNDTKKDYRALLNLNNNTKESACKAANEFTPTLSNKCVSSSIIYSGFNDNNISGFTEKISIGGQNAYCVTNFSLDTDIFSEGTVTQTGRLMFGSQSSTSSNILGNAKLIKKCYYNANTLSFLKRDFSYTDYIKSISVFNSSGEYSQILNASIPDNPRACTKNQGLFNCEYEVNYTKTNYLSMINGNLLSGVNGSCKTNGTCRAVDGLFLKFTDNMISIIPNISLGNKYSNLSFTQSEEDKCKYEIPPIFVINKKLNLEFRIVDTTNPFPGESGRGRTVGSNWCDNVNQLCTSKSEQFSLKIKKYILEANDSMNKYPEKGLKYEPIILTPKIITSIREYNNKHSYDEYLLKELTNNSMIYKVQTLQRQDGTKKFANNFFYEINDKYNNFIKKLR